MKAREYLKKTAVTTEDYPPLRSGLICKGGFKMSVQASWGHYCEPRDNRGFYFSAEIGFPSEVEPLLKEYAEDWSVPTETVYGYVPVEVIDSVIEKHGGIDLLASKVY